MRMITLAIKTAFQFQFVQNALKARNNSYDP